ncbi:hypothetical protein GCM10008023_15940 [Sphingomonas glacialis]|uniref:DUF4062 domain-containing protein n=1 Tax=Sphingomonas glacialis TaxID=658225 RepID=A0ABQ3LFU8_9SPHN|nr:DUF4062 domain-containing protein [Sphingomonas glacialis]GHH14340.1 hypothetical protein GCM10008023_15940 [Sphingomonas glacialis]
MAHPRVFLSSTYYDLKNVRVAISAFIRSMGYDVTLNEVGSIAYGKTSPLDMYCYDEIRSCDIVVSIIGGRFGSTSSDGNGSISQNELRTALELGKQVYIFVDRNVLSEFNTYRKNKNAQISWAHVDNVAIYQFIEDLYDLPFNNAIFSFDDSESIITILKEQWSGLFQRLLQESGISGQVTIAQELSQGLTTLRQIIDEISSKNADSSPTVSSLVALQHPAFSRLKKLLNVKYRVFFSTNQEMQDWLRSRQFFMVDKLKWDEPDVQEWISKKYDSVESPHPLLKIHNIIFDEEGVLKSLDELDWSDKLIDFVTYDPSSDVDID